MVALELNPTSKSGKTTYTDIVKIATAQGRSHIQSLINNDILYVDNNKNRVKQWLNVNRLQLPLRSSTDNSNNSISNSNENVKFSLKEDSEGNKLSAQQQEYFANSKAVDKNGNLLVLYHQTGADFTVFNTDNQKAGKYDSELPTGIFLKPTKNDIGLSGKKQMKVYTNMINPLIMNNRSEAKHYFENNISGYKAAQDRITDIDKEYQKKYDEADIRDDEVYKQLFQEFKSKKISNEEFKNGIENTETKRILNEWSNASDIARLDAKLLIDNYFSDSDYDGMIVINDTGSFGRSVKSYIVFNSNQIKNIDNAKPTDNVDIRYSLDTDYTYKTLVSKPDMVITKVNDNIENYSNRTQVVTDTLNNVKQVGKINSNNELTIYVDDLQKEVVVGNKGIKHGLNRKYTEKIPVTLEIGSILKNSIVINQLKPKKADAKQTYVLIGAAESSDNLYIVESLVNSFTNELFDVNVLYSINNKKEAVSLNGSDFTDSNLSSGRSASTISISDLLDYVNRYYPDILPEDVFKHYGYNHRPDGILGESALYSLDVGENNKKIAMNMSDNERYEILKNRVIKNIPAVSVAADGMKSISSWNDINKVAGREKRALIKKITEEFSVFKGYSNADIELDFEFTKNNFRESYSKQGKNFEDFAKMFSVFDSIVNNAVGIEIHNRNNEGYKVDVTLENVYVLVSAFQDEDSIIPVKLEIKQFSDKPNKLYVAVTSDKIKMTEVWKQGDTINGVTQDSRSVNISISDLFKKINPESQSLYKYIPKQFFEVDNQYSLDVEHEAEQLRMQNEKLQKANEYLKQEFKLTHGRVTNANAALAIAKRIKGNWNTQMTSAEIANKLVVLSDDGANGGYGTYEDLYHKAHKIAESVIENQQMHIDDYSQEILNTIRSYEFYLTESQKNAAAETFGSYGEFYRSNFGRMKIKADSNTSLVDVWNALCESYPEYFSEDIHDNDMAVELADIISALKDNTVSEFGFDREGAETALTAEIIEAYFDLPMKQTYADKVQKEINRLKYEYKTALQENKTESKARYEAELKSVKEHHKNRIKQEKDAKWDRVRQEKEIRKRMLKDQRIRKNESVEKTKLKASIRKSLNKIARLGANPTKNKHLPNSIIDSVKALASAITLGESQYDIKLTSRLNDIRNGYEHIKDDSQYSVISELYDNYISQQITDLQKKSGNKSLNDLSLSDLREIDRLVKMTVQTVSNINKLFAQERNATLSEYVENINAELSPMAKKEKLKLPYNLIYGSMKPEYFFEYIGSDTLTQLYKSLQGGEDVFATDVYEDKQFLDGKRKKYKADKWDWKKVYTVETFAGETLDFSLGQVLAVYANTKRKQCRYHLLGGGIKYEPVKNKIKSRFVISNDQSVHRINEEDVGNIISYLTEGQKAYADDVIKYMSTVVSEKGNAVSRQLYDVELFNEKSYYPIMTEKNYIHSTSTETKGAKKIINSGFTKATIEKAENPIILMEFDEAVARHLNDMAKYHAFALPLEDFDRVYHAFGRNSNGDYNSIKTVIENGFTKSAIAYIDKLLEDINGNTIRSAETGAEKFISLWKKNAVMASASVVIQQPSAVARALSEIDAKYFTKFTLGIKNNNKAYEQIKKYAPVAILKEMGSFDTGTARGTVDYLVDKKDIKSQIDNAMSVGAEKADQWTWVHIWNACVNESRAKNKGASQEEILTLAGARFTDVVKKTQVYDSVFSRSGLMRNKDNFSKITTAFMAEPTTSLNMAVNAFVQAKRGKISKGKATMTLTSLMLASVLNTLLKRLVKAARDDDDDKTYWEKYLSGIPSDFVDEVNPLNNIAVIKDVYSIFKGYDVDRADMTLISEFYDAMYKLFNSDSATTSEKIQSIASATAGLFGLPVKNVIRDINAVVNVIKGMGSDLEYSETVTAQEVAQNLEDTFVFDDILETLFGISVFGVKDKNRKLYDAVIEDDEEVYKRLTADKDEDQVSSKLKTALIENDARIAESAVAYANGKMSSFDALIAGLVSDGFEEEIAVAAVKNYYNTMKQAKAALDEKDMETYEIKLQKLLESGYDKDKIIKAINAIESEEESENDLSQIYNANMVAMALDESNYTSAEKYINSIVDIQVANGKTKEEARKSVKTSLTSIYKPIYLEDSSQRSSIENKLMRTGLYEEEDFPEWIAKSYDTDSMLAAFDNGYENTKKYIQERINAKVAAGQTEKDAISEIKKAIANEYKAEFLKGDADTRAQIMKYMVWTGIYGDKSDVMDYIDIYWRE